MANPNPNPNPPYLVEGVWFGHEIRVSYVRANALERAASTGVVSELTLRIDPAACDVEEELDAVYEAVFALIQKAEVADRAPPPQVTPRGLGPRPSGIAEHDSG